MSLSEQTYLTAFVLSLSLPRGRDEKEVEGRLRVVEGEGSGCGGPFVLAFGPGHSWLR